MGAFGLTEPLSGSDTARGLRTTAHRTGDTWVLNGAKRWIGNATFADLIVIWARDTADDQVKGFLVRRGTPGFTATKIERKQALRSVQNADILLDGVEVSEADRLPNIHSFRDVATVLRLTRAEVAWQAVGVAVGAYEATVKYALEREQFGKPIASFQLVQDRLARCLGNITASIALCVRASQLGDQDRQGDQHSALAKAYTTTAMRETVALCRETLGGNGIQLDHGVARYMADAEAVYSFEGTRDMNNLIVGPRDHGHRRVRLTTATSEQMRVPTRICSDVRSDRNVRADAGPDPQVLGRCVSGLRRTGRPCPRPGPACRRPRSRSSP